MRWLRVRSILLPALVLSMAACETEPPMAPYFLTAPDSVAPDISSTLSRWDSRTELAQWVANPWTQAPYTIGFESGVEFAHADLRTGVNSSLYGPDLQPPFEGLQSVRVRLRYFLLGTGTGTLTSDLIVSVSASVAPAGRDDPTNHQIPRYSARVTAGPGEWQVVELQPDLGRGYPPVVDARWLSVAIGRNYPYEIVGDIDWIELVRN
jgi:hypothetical protein